VGGHGRGRERVPTRKNRANRKFPIERFREPANLPVTKEDGHVPPILYDGDGKDPGAFKSPGTGAQKGRIPVLAIEFEVISPRDAATGQASGKRVFKPIVFKKEIDAASPQFLTSLATNETLTEVVFQFATVGSDGKEATYYTLTSSRSKSRSRF